MLYPPEPPTGLDCVFSQEESVLEEAAVLSRMSQNSSIVSLLSLDSLPSYHYLVLEVRHNSEGQSKGSFVANASTTGLF